MTRPSAAQLTYGSVTVVFSTLAMLLLSRTTSGIGVGIIGICALGVGLLVAVTVPLPGRAKAKAATTVCTTASSQAGTDQVAATVEARLPAPRPGARRTERVGEHSLHG